MRRKLLTIAEFVFILGILFVLGFFTYLYLEQPWRNLTASATQQTLGLSLDIASQNNNNQGENQGGGGGGGGGGGVTTVPGSSAVTPIIVPASTVYTFGTFNLPQLFASIAPTGKLSFVLDGEDHSVQVFSLTSNSVILVFASAVKEFSLSLGETKQIDLNNDGKIDLLVTFTSITNGRADLTLMIPTQLLLEPFKLSVDHITFTIKQGETGKSVLVFTNLGKDALDVLFEIQGLLVILLCFLQDYLNILLLFFLIVILLFL